MQKPDGMATRLSCFSLISAVETDLRNYLRESLSAAGIPEFLSPQLRESARERQKKDSDLQERQRETEFALLDYLDFGHLGELILSHRHSLPSASENSAIRAARALAGLVPIRNRVCHSRPLEYDDFSTLFDFASEQSGERSLPWLEVRAAVRTLRENPAAALSMRIPSYWDDSKADIFNNLPPPDFEDTGFIGRKNDVDNVKKLILGPYPVISLIGEGGVGKTSLALRALFDLVEEGAGTRFDAIVWVSLKTSVLTPTGVEELRSAITDTLGMFNAVVLGLGSPGVRDQSITAQLGEVTEYLAQFRVLVALDNLETIPHEDVFAFLRGLPDGSKVLITSRIGLGQLEHAYPLAPFNQRDAANLLRRAALSQNLREIHAVRNEVVDRWCKRLSYNPLAIKWFVASVGLGRDPNDLLNRTSKDYQQLLRFSFENLYASLSPLSKTILATIYVVGSPLTKAEIAVLLETIARSASIDDIEMGLRGLVNASVVQRVAANEGGHAARYKLGAFAQQFLSNIERPDREFVAAVQAGMRRLRSSIEELSKRVSYYRFDQHAIHWKHPDERLVSAKLRQALDFDRRGQFSRALEMVAIADRMLPQFSENRRVRAMILRNLGDHVAAREEYEAAMELDPNSQVTRFSFGQFLITELQDCEAALVVLSPLVSGQEIAVEPRSLVALAHQRCGQLREAAAQYEALMRDPNSPQSRYWVAIRDQAAETYRRLSELDLRNREQRQFREHIERAMEIAVGVAAGDGALDSKSHRRLESIVVAALRGALAAHDRALAESVFQRLRDSWHQLPGGMEIDIPPSTLLQEFGDMPDCQWLTGMILGNAKAEPSKSSDTLRRRDRIISFANNAPYGFIEDEEGGRWFFHRNHLRDITGWQAIHTGQRVEFDIGSNQRGDCAVDVTFP